MPTVSVEVDARYAWDERGRRFFEVCPSCEQARPPLAAHCRCGLAFEPRSQSFFTTKWEPHRCAIDFPQQCPHCGGAPDKSIEVWGARHTGVGRGGATTTHIAFDVPVCARFPSSLWRYFALIASGVLLALMLLSALFSVAGGIPWVQLGLAAIVVTAMVRLWRARSWIRLVRFDHRSYRFRVRRLPYALALARANGGRILGSRWS